MAKAQTNNLEHLLFECRLPRLAAILILTLAALLAIMPQVAKYRGLPVEEDSAIFLRYSEHFNFWHDIAYNPGGPRVEGATSLPFMLLTSVVLALKAPLLQSPVIVSGIFFALAIGALILYVSKNAAWPVVLPFLTFSLAGSNLVPLVFEGFDAPVAFCASAITAILFIKATSHPERSAWPFLVSALALGAFRPDCLPLAFVALCAYCRQVRTKRAFSGSLAVVGGIAAFEILRFCYFGYLFPNAFYVKHQGSTLHVSTWIRATLNSLIANPCVCACLLLLVGGYALRTRPRPILVATCLIGLIGLTQWVVISDEMNRFGRFQLPSVAWFIVAMCSPQMVELLRPSALLKLLAVLSFFGPSAILAILSPRLASRLFPLDTSASKRNLSIGRTIGGLVKSGTIPAQTRLVVTEAGYIPLLSRLPSMDAWGLNDLRVAHQGLTGEYLNEWGGEIVYLHRQAASPLAGWSGMTNTIDGWLSSRSFELIAWSPSTTSDRFEVWIAPNEPWAVNLVAALREGDDGRLYRTIDAESLLRRSQAAGRSMAGSAK